MCIKGWERERVVEIQLWIMIQPCLQEVLYNKEWNYYGGISVSVRKDSHDCIIIIISHAMTAVAAAVTTVLYHTPTIFSYFPWPSLSSMSHPFLSLVFLCLPHRFEDRCIMVKMMEKDAVSWPDHPHESTSGLFFLVSNQVRVDTGTRIVDGDINQGMNFLDTAARSESDLRCPWIWFCCVHIFFQNDDQTLGHLLIWWWGQYK